MRQLRLREKFYYLVVILLTTALAACTEEQASPDPVADTPRSAPNAAAMYGVNAQVSYPGETGSLAEQAMVYVFLRSPGSNMPLAVQHFPASELPKRVSFSGTSQEEDFELVARLSFSGRVDRSAEDLEAIQVITGFRHPPQNYAMVLGEHEETVAVRDSASVSIRTEVAIEDSHSFPADTVVFVIARQPGQAMPSVVKRLSLADLPLRIELTDEDAMTFSGRISYAERLDLFARVSSSGTATQSNADWVSETVHLETARLPELVVLTIGRPAAQ
jgi:hypothetical protein